MYPVEIRDKLIAIGWKLKRKHLYYTRENGVRLRMYFGKISMRLDRELVIPPTATQIEQTVWIRITGDFYSRVLLLPDKRIRIGSIILGEQNADGMGSKGK